MIVGDVSSVLQQRVKTPITTKDKKRMFETLKTK